MPVHFSESNSLFSKSFNFDTSSFSMNMSTIISYGFKKLVKVTEIEIEILINKDKVHTHRLQRVLGYKL
jgi:hypothetical protein